MSGVMMIGLKVRWGVIFAALFVGLGLSGCGGGGVEETTNIPGSTAPDTTAPSTPTGLTATAASSSQINLSWTAATDNVGVTGYNVYRGGGQIATLGAVTTFQNNGLTASTTYSYTVQAFDAVGNLSAPSSSASATTQAPAVDTTLPSTPAGLTATAASSSQINLSWTSATDNVGVTGYNVYRGGIQIATLGAVTTFQNTGLTASTTYSYTVRAFDAAGNVSAPSSSAGATTQAPPADTTAPSAPTGLTATAASSSQINLSWTAATDNVGVVQYRVERCQGSSCSTFAQIGTTPGTTTIFSDTTTGLVPNTTFRYRVRAADAAPNLGPYSNLVNVTTPGDVTPPVISSGAPTGTLAAGTTQATMSVASNESATCKWDTSAATSYAAMPNTFTTTGGTFHSTQLTPLSNGQTYTSYVRCQDGAGNANTSSYTVSFSVGTGAGPITLPTAASIPSRTSGVAPLAVFFDATGTTSTLTTRPFHDIEYRWDFGDRDVNTGDPNMSPPITGAITWATGSRGGDPLNLRNLATGPVAAHVYETTGTYTVTLTVTDGTNTDTTTLTITVDNADDVFAATKTICFSNTNNPSSFVGCPPAAQQVANSSNFATAIAQATTGKRVLFQRGGTWIRGTTLAHLSQTGPGIVGAYGSGAAPLIRTTLAVDDEDILQISGSATPASFSDWRIMDLEFDGQNNPRRIHAIKFGAGADQVTLLRLNIHHILQAINASSFVLTNGGGEHVWDQMAVVDGVFQHFNVTSGGQAAYMSGQRFAIMGCLFDDVQNHVVRIPQMTKGVISNSVLSGAQAGFNTLKLHAPCQGGLPGGCDILSVENGAFTEQVVISDNKFVGGPNNLTIEPGPQNSSADERLRDLIIERNWFVGGAGTQVHLTLNAARSTVRNNIIDLSGSTFSEQYGVSVARRGVEPVADGNRIYNNTIFFSGSTDFTGVQVQSGATNTVVKNNLGYALSASPKTMVSDSSASTTKDHNTGDVGSLTTNPSFASGSPSVPAHFKIQTGSYAKDAGTSVPVFSDFFRLSRPQNGSFDLGATEFQP
jgi:chitodextrinase/PKD repeat protein